MAVLALVMVLLVVAVVMAAAVFAIYEIRQNQGQLQNQLEQQGRELAGIREASQQTTQRMEGLETRINPTISRIDEQLGRLGESASRILEVGKDITTLQDILQPPKLRGELGELLLEQLLAQILPSAHFSLQHPFRNGERVDAVIHLPEGVVPVDAKFPMESFLRMLATENEEERNRKRREFIQAVKKHVDSVRKYIRPDEGTLDFVLMYIPAENVYYETIVGGGDEGLLSYALQQRVHLVSPNTFYAFLQAIARGLRGLKVEQYAREIIGNLERLQGDFSRFRDDFRTLGEHIRRAESKYREVDAKVDKLERKMALPVAAEQLPLPPADNDRV